MLVIIHCFHRHVNQDFFTGVVKFLRNFGGISQSGDYGDCERYRQVFKSLHHLIIRRLITKIVKNQDNLRNRNFLSTNLEILREQTSKNRCKKYNQSLKSHLSMLLF